jgi:hypothetical protein
MNGYRGTKEIAATIRETLKAKYPEFKFSVRKSDYNAIYVSVMSGPYKILLDGVTQHQINHYHLANAPLTVKGRKLLEDVTKISLLEHWDDSDARIDYFNCAFYFHLEVGQWNKPYTLVNKKVKKTKKGKK